MTLRLRQVALAAHDLEAVTTPLCEVLDIAVGYRDPGVAVFGLVNAVAPVGREFLEVVSPNAPDAAAGRYLERRGGDCGYMVMLQTSRWEADRQRAEAQGVRIVWQGEIPGIRGLHLHPRDTGGALLSLDEPEPADAWGWAGPAWTEHVRTERVTGLRGVTLGCPDPKTVAARWGELLDLPAGVDAGGDASLALEDGFVRFVGSSGPAEEGVVGVTLSARAPDAVLRAARERGLANDAGGFTLCGTRFELEAD